MSTLNELTEKWRKRYSGDLQCGYTAQDGYIDQFIIDLVNNVFAAAYEAGREKGRDETAKWAEDFYVQ